MHEAAEEVVAQRRQAELALLVVEQVVLAGAIPHRDMHMAAIAGEVDEGLRHEGGAKPMLLGDRLHHELEEAELVGRGQRVVEVPVDLELAVGVLMIVLIGPPAEIDHGGADLGDDVEAAHDRRLVVAGLLLRIARVGNRRAIGIDEMEFGLDARHQLHVALAALLEQALEHEARRLADRLAFHPRIARHPGDFRLPWQLDHRLRHRA